MWAEKFALLKNFLAFLKSNRSLSERWKKIDTTHMLLLEPEDCLA